jgi:hypothetical protein
MWAQERYSLYPARWKRSASSHTDTVVWNTIRALRSAAGHFFTLDLLTAHPGRLVADHRDQPVLAHGCAPTNELGFSHFSASMKRQVGEHTQPSAPLLEKHIQWIEDLVERQYHAATTSIQRRTACQIAVTNLVGWLAWLRAQETFCLTWKDALVLSPADGPSPGLPEGLGVVLLKLLAQTKSSQSRTADVVVSYTTASGLSLGTWLDRLRAKLGSDCDPDAYIICHETGRQWTSHHYRHTYLYPFLETQRQLGDPVLGQCDGTAGNWSFHAYRRGARTHVSQKRCTNTRKATDTEVDEHGRWCRKRSSMRMSVAYLEWSLEDHLMLTLLCM